MRVASATAPSSRETAGLGGFDQCGGVFALFQPETAIRLEAVAVRLPDQGPVRDVDAGAAARPIERALRLDHGRRRWVSEQPDRRRPQGLLAAARSGSGSGSASMASMPATYGAGNSCSPAPAATRSRYHTQGRPSPTQSAFAR